VAGKLNKPIHVVHTLFGFNEPAASADNLSNNGNKLAIDTIADNQNHTPENEYVEQATGKLLGHWLDLLPMQQRIVVEHRFGLHHKGRRTLEEVGQLLGVTRERVRQVQLAALTRLREISRREGVIETPFMK
jgi:RNA polymerase nonessential primary-like sigma factor